MPTSRLPFAVSKNETFYEGLNNWIGDVFYDILPEKGFELRDEQIFMAFQLERAFREKNVMFAEAGVGTGKTLVYLLYAISYARYTGKPAIIACADETLIEQLVKNEGDIAKLRKHLDLNIDVRLGKSQDQYLCLKKLDQTIQRTGDDLFLDLFESLPSFVHEKAGMQSFSHYGDRKEYPHLSDEEWNTVNYDSFQDCLSCDQRHRCGLTLSRDHYRKAADLIVCSHDFYMEHIWTFDSRKREGQLPLLPEHSSVVFDEGHLLEYAAQKALTYRVKSSTLAVLLERLLQNDIREEFAHLVEDTLVVNEEFFDSLLDASEEVPGSHRSKIMMNNTLKKQGIQLHRLLAEIGEALVFESEMYTIDSYELKIVEEYLDSMEFSISLFNKQSGAIHWIESGEQDFSLIIMPRTVEEVLREKVFSQKKPYVFSSATLSNNKSFDFIAGSLGVKDYLSLTVESPFDYEENMKIKLHDLSASQDLNKMKCIQTLEKVKKTGGRALILFSAMNELEVFKQYTSEQNTEYSFLFEGDQEISQLVSEFQNDETSILCAVHLWEGLDIPGASLSNVIIWSLPFPPTDPVFESKRGSTANPFADVDMPYMILRLKQGIGRLIRTSTDQGEISIYLSNERDVKVMDQVKAVLPVEPEIV
ncbi:MULTISPECIES: ATP-dependent DNA helicase [Metabacillus]|uniref:ATP-dependent DNA helicase n=1 Tax=Metabacillus hrfriensis TaxID=3048891 RepID=A0ACD4R7Y6_9BACI|nr:MULTISPECIES: ATP-dependent DNA helicase [Metabacillus]UAL50758.1 ATP-dependent DNA helicase [Metabacillus dongyingensis]USK27030.1 ATP-dependent DNA helicase [Bacillus sp. CMF21]WHZ56252.1 ATP-dependent DNA helicase [Metabacillus sp. CT-WN-B3]